MSSIQGSRHHPAITRDRHLLKILAITYCFAPIQMPATMRLLKWFKGLGELGHEVTVLAIDPDSFSGPKDDELNRLIPSNVKVIRVWSPENSLLYRALRKQYRLFYKLFEPRKMEWYRAALKAAEAIDTNGYDVIFSCSQPHSCHLIGKRLKEKTGKRWVAYFSDPWTDNPYTKYVNSAVFKYNQALEKGVIEGADSILFPSDEMVGLVMNKYPARHRAKCGVIPHCFVPDWYGLTAAPVRNGKLRLVQTGNFYGPRSPMPLLKALHRLMKETEIASRAEVLSFGKSDPAYPEYVRSTGMGSFVRFNDTIPYLESLSAMKASDYLLLIDAPSDESVFLPSKLVDYIGSGAPVLGITPGKGASARVLKETGNISCDVSDEEAVYRTLKGVAGGALAAKPDRERIALYDYRKIAGLISDEMKGRSQMEPAS